MKSRGDAMNLRKLFVSLLLGIWASLFCVVSFVNASRVVSITTAENVSEQDTTPLGVKNRFTPEAPEIHTVSTLTEVKAGTIFKGVWIAVDAISTPNYEITSSEVQIQQDGEALVHFSISKPQQGWPVGNYKFELRANDQVLGSALFSVVRGTAAASPQAAPTQPSPPRPVAHQPFSGFNLGPVREDRDRLWTVIVYMDGDNNLEPFALGDLEEMQRALPAKGVDVIVLLDRAEGFSDADGDWTDARVFRVRKDTQPGIRSEILQQPGELNLGDPAVLQGFLSAAIKTFPAQRYALILWNHGGGWAGHVMDEKAPGVPSGEDKLTLPKLRAAVAGALKEAQLKSLDLIGFDMCLMAQLETAYEIEGLADIMVGSEAVEPGDGWPYDAVLPLFANRALSTKEIARGIVKAFDDFYKAKQELITTQSAFDLSVVSEVVKAFNGVAGRLDTTLPEVWPSLTRTLFFSESYGDIADVRRGKEGLLSMDLADAFQNLVGVLPSLGSSPEFKAFQEVLGRFVLDNKNSQRHGKSRGVAIYAPFRQDLYNPEYEQTRFARESQWGSTLKQLYATQARNPDRPQITGIQTVSLLRNKPVQEVIQLGQDGFAFTFDGRNILWAFASLGVRDEANRRTLVFQKSILHKPREEDFLRSQKKSREEILGMYSYSDGAHTVGFRYDGTRRLVSNGQQSFPATMDESNVGNLGAHIIAVPALVEHPKIGKYFATIYFNWTWRAAAVRLEIPQKDGSYAYAQIKPPPDADIHLLVEALPDQEKQTYLITETLKWENGLFLTVDLAPPREYEVLLTVESLGGISNTTRHRFQVAARDDDLLKGLKEAPEEMLMENFLGEWEFVDAEKWFKEGRMVSIGAFARYEPHPRHKGLMKLTLYKPKGREVYPGLDVVEVIQQQGLPHLRQYVLNQEGHPQADYGYRMSFPVFDFKDGHYLLLSMDLATGDLGVKVKRSGPTPKLKTTGTASSGGAAAQPGMTSPGTPGTGLDGVWRADDGSAIVFAGNQWAYTERNKVKDRGIFVIRNNQLACQSQGDGTIYTYNFQISGNQLMIQEVGSKKILRFYRAR